jgi:hypothetical protein
MNSKYGKQLRESYLFQIILGEFYENYYYRTDFLFQITNYNGFQNNQVNLY